MSSKESTTSSISRNEIENIVLRLQRESHRDSTRKMYYSVWKSFSKFYFQLDVKPLTWEVRIILFAVYLIDQNKKSMTVKSYISAIKTILVEDAILMCENKYLLSSITRACKLTRDTVTLHLPISQQMLNMLIKTTAQFFMQKGQHGYILQLFATAFYGLFRIGEITWSEHVVKACDVHLASNKRKLLFILCSSKTHNRGMPPQTIKILSNNRLANTSVHNHHNCPYQLLRNCLTLRDSYLVLARTVLCVQQQGSSFTRSISQRAVFNGQNCRV